MKPCSNNRKLIAWLALDALDAQRGRALRAHLQTCAGCRRYLEEVSEVTQKLAAAEAGSDIRSSESFHQKVVCALRAEGTGAETWVAQLRATLSNWRVALPLIGATAIVIAALSIVARHPGVPLSTPARALVVLTPNTKPDLAPTISNYQMVANRSLEELDELLTRQGNRNSSPAQILTPSALARATALE